METSHYNKGKLGWCWMFTSNEGSFLKLTDSRGMKVLENSAFGSNDNIIVTDRYAPIIILLRKTDKSAGHI